MNVREILVCSLPLLIVGVLNRVGHFGSAKIDLCPQGKVVFEKPFKKNCGLFEYYSYVRHDTSDTVERVAPQFIYQTEWGLSLKPVEFVFK